MTTNNNVSIKYSNEWNPETKTIVSEQAIGNLVYTVKCGEIAVDSPDGKVENINSGKVFYTAYFVQKPARPIMFLFNGGPGGSSAYLHFGGLGPKRVSNLDVEDGELISTMVEQPESLLQQCDLVFVDPIGTGFSSCKENLLKEFCTENADSTYICQFIIRFLGLYNLWGREIQLCGESFGAYRVCLLSHKLITQHQVYPAKLLLIAPFISGIAIEAGEPNIVAEANLLVSLITNSWFHRRSFLNSTHQEVASVYAEASNFCFTEYLPARMKYSPWELPAEIIEKVCAWTGLAKEVYTKHGLNISTWSQFLFPEEKRFPGYVDGRFTLEHPLTFSPNYLCPAAVSVERRMLPIANAYFRELGWEANVAYTSFTPNVAALWQYEEPFFSSAFTCLRDAMKLNPNMQIYAAAGYYDLAVPAATVEYDLKQIADTSSLAKRIRLEFFEAGHMMYIHNASRLALLKGFCSSDSRFK